MAVIICIFIFLLVSIWCPLLFFISWKKPRWARKANYTAKPIKSFLSSYCPGRHKSACIVEFRKTRPPVTPELATVISPWQKQCMMGEFSLTHNMHKSRCVKWGRSKLCLRTPFSTPMFSGASWGVIMEHFPGFVIPSGCSWAGFGVLNQVYVPRISSERTSKWHCHHMVCALNCNVAWNFPQDKKKQFFKTVTESDPKVCWVQYQLFSCDYC